MTAVPIGDMQLAARCNLESTIQQVGFQLNLHRQRSKGFKSINWVLKMLELDLQTIL